MKRRLHVRSGDMVEVVSGISRGMRGRVLRAMPEQGKVVVEGARLVWKHLNRSREHPRGGRIQVEAPIDASNVMLICSNRDCRRHDKPVRSRAMARPDGAKVRACASCGGEIHRPE